MNDDMLESKMFYRLVKVVHVVILSILILGVLFLGGEQIPYKIVDTNKSYLTCPDGKQYSFRSLGILLHSKSRDYTDYDIEKAIKICNKLLKPIQQTTENSSDIEWELVAGEPYPTHWEDEVIGSWIEVVKIWFIGFVISFLSLNLFKQAVLYIVYGRKITFLQS